MRSLKKYLVFAKSGMFTTLVYRSQIFLWFLGGIVIGIVTSLLWMAIYSFSPNEEINGFILSEMILYVLIVVVINEVNYSSTFSDIADDIKQGLIGMRLMKPVSYRMQLSFKTIGNFFIRLVIVGVPFLIIFAGFCCLVLKTPVPIWWHVLLFFPLMLVSIVIVDAFQFIFGLCGFITQEMFGLNMVLSAVISFLSGVAIPISFFPQWLQNVIYCTPFPSMISYPALLFMGKLSDQELIKAFLLGIAWIIGLKLIGAFLYQKAVKHVVVFGG